MSPDGRQLLIGVSEGACSRGSWPPSRGRRAPPAERGLPFSEEHPEISPDGLWTAFESGESGQREVYVDTLTGGSRRQASLGGGQAPLWNRNGSELFYVARDGTLTSVVLRHTAAGLEIGQPQPLFPLRLGGRGGEIQMFRRSYDVSPDGQRFLVIRRASRHGGRRRGRRHELDRGAPGRPVTLAGATAYHPDRMGLASGTKIGPYEILAPLGAGGMGEVYRARDARLGRSVALKILPERLSADPERLSRFEKEARSASALNHPNVVTIYEVGTDGGISYIAMELVEGKTLRELIAAGPLPQRKILHLGAQIADGLAKAHAAGVVHRDFKPENLMVSDDGFVKIVDFGLAKLTEPTSEERIPTS